MTHRAKHHRHHRGKKMLIQYCGFLLILSISFSLMPFGVLMANQTMLMTYLAGSLFWIGLIGTVTAAIIILRSKRRDKGFKKTCHHYKQWGLVHFFQNKPAVIFDVLLFVSITGFVLARLFLDTTVCPFIFLSLLILSFGMHCMLNGSSYMYIGYKMKEVL